MKKFLVALTFLLLSTLADASPVNYNLVLDVNLATGFNCNPLISFPSFACPNGTISSQYIGHFTIDDSLLALEGDQLLADISNFVLQIGTLVWNQNLKFPGSDFSGFRQNPQTFASSPGFNVHGGQIVCLTGGVYGAADAPFVDFFCNTFHAIDLQNNFIQGALSVALASVPEPPAWLLMGLGLMGARVALIGFRSFP
jgi:hypothetical protein